MARISHGWEGAGVFIFLHWAPQLTPAGPFFSAAGRTRLLLVREAQCHKLIRNFDAESDYKPPGVCSSRLRRSRGKRAVRGRPHSTFAPNEPDNASKKRLKNTGLFLCGGVAVQHLLLMICSKKPTDAKFAVYLLLFDSQRSFCEEKHFMYLYFGATACNMIIFGAERMYPIHFTILTPGPAVPNPLPCCVIWEQQ